jgi:GNAT superfamily N-acetyltransferase
MIRLARPGDVAEIHRLIRELAEYERSADQVAVTQDDLRRALFGERPAVFAHVAVHPSPDHQTIGHEGAVAGFALWFVNYSTWAGRHGIYLEDLYVTPTLRRHGYGRALLAELARICVERGYGRLEWSVLDWNKPAIGFYESLGAVAMDEWTVHRLVGPALHALAARPGR